MERLSKLECWEERQTALAQGFLTGNIFDWGASEAVRFFMQSQSSVEGMASFEQTLAKLQVSTRWVPRNLRRFRGMDDGAFIPCGVFGALGVCLVVGTQWAPVPASGSWYVLASMGTSGTWKVSKGWPSE